MTHHHAEALRSHNSHASNDPWRKPSPELLENMEFEAKLSEPVVQSAIDYAVASMEAAPSIIVDLGSGLGGGTIALARRFPEARVHALDVSEGLLEQVTPAAAAAKVEDRVQGHIVNLESDWARAVTGGVDLASSIDLAWASLSLHHVSNVAQVLKQILATLRPSGVLVLTELTGTAVFKPADLGTGSRDLAATLAHLVSDHEQPQTRDWASLLAEAGFVSVELHETELSVSTESPEGAHYLAAQLRSYRDRLASELISDDLNSFDAATASIGARASDLSFASGRAIWVAAMSGR